MKSCSGSGHSRIYTQILWSSRVSQPDLHSGFVERPTQNQLWQWQRLQPAVSAQQKAVSAQQKAVAAQQKAVSAQQNAVSAQQEAVAAQQKTVSAQQKALSAQQRQWPPNKRVSSQAVSVQSLKRTLMVMSSCLSNKHVLASFHNKHVLHSALHVASCCLMQCRL